MSDFARAVLQCQPAPEQVVAFGRTFGVPFRDFRDCIGALDIVAFDSWLGAEDGRSCYDRIATRFGASAAELVAAMIRGTRADGA